MSRSISALTLWQPWASLVAIGAKPLEFRSWSGPRSLHGQRIAIHAGARKCHLPEVYALLVKLRGPNARETGLVADRAIALLEGVLTGDALLPRGAVVCLATLGMPICNAELAARLGVDLVHDSDRGQHTNWGWPLTDIVPLEPVVPARGGQGFWPWRGMPAELAA